MNCKYVIDSSVIIRRSQHDIYELDSFPIHWKNFDDKIQDGTIVSTPLVQKEINNHPKYNLLDWPKKNDIMFQKINNKVVAELNLLSLIFKPWYESNKDQKKYWADPEIIAFAKAYNIIVVTQEKWNGNSTEQHNYRIPTICSKLGAFCKINDQQSTNVDESNPFQCINFFELIKREKLYE